jgi:hypothetical protein
MMQTGWRSPTDLWLLGGGSNVINEENNVTCDLALQSVFTMFLIDRVFSQEQRKVKIWQIICYTVGYLTLLYQLQKIFTATGQS